MSSLDDLYRRVIMDHYQKPRNKGKLDEAEGLTINLNNPTCGDSISLSLKVEDGIVTDAKFLGEGCSISMSSASMMTEAVKGKPVDEAIKLAQVFSDLMQGKQPEDDSLDLGDIEALSGVAKFPARIKCATLAWKALEQGVRQANQS
ncbi:Fe-S cluster assembly sulfur transfer protein SufU [Brevibacillus dissolubilis]|uniref:Fe-S cluster assembly sulfur transfer protein SufU n=1 Tax=Brevibacillus dissolubilis TaxID=1844116 RepID=UPI0011177F1D|nr:SUF system NifU family Fe-S cluster assembly protein [Brevibacillus dissolubilis]